MEDVDWIHLDREKRLTVVNTGMTSGFHETRGIS